MRLFLIPITTRRTLIYGQRLHQITHAVPSRADKTSERAAKLWLQWESGGKSWQKKVIHYGNKLFGRIPFEEWGLKSIPPLSARRQEHEIHDKRVDVVYPSSMIDEGAVPTILQRLATERDSLHRKRLIWSVVGMPIAAPFGLVPVIPNIPFFYLAYRAFSHWKALSGAKHLNFLVGSDLLRPVRSAALDSVYARHATARKTDREILLIEGQDAQTIARVLDFPALAMECERAAKQAAEQMRLRAEEDVQNVRLEKAKDLDRDINNRSGVRVRSNHISGSTKKHSPYPKPGGIASSVNGSGAGQRGKGGREAGQFQLQEADASQASKKPRPGMFSSKKPRPRMSSSKQDPGVSSSKKTRPRPQSGHRWRP